VIAAPAAVPTPAPMTVSFSRVDMPPHAVRLVASKVQTNHFVDLFIVDLHFPIAWSLRRPGAR
jgi:hypothetical protein